MGSPEAQHHAVLANLYTPELKTHDGTGHRIDAVEFHPSYHVLMGRAFGAGLHSLAWKRDSGGFVAAPRSSTSGTSSSRASRAP